LRLREIRRGKRTGSGGDGLSRTDWIGTAAFVARYAPGFGNPLDQPIDVFAAIVESVSDMIQSEHGDSGRAAVDREMRRMLG
jgi:hypothetical protein